MAIILQATRAAARGSRSSSDIPLSTTGKRAGRRVALPGLALLWLLAGPLAKAEAGGTARVPAGARISAARPSGTVAERKGPAQVLAAPVANARTSQILLNSYGNTPLAVPLAATSANTGGSIASYTVTVLPPSAAGVLRINGTTTVTTSTVIAAADAGNLTFDPAAGYFGTALFQYLAKDNTGTSSVAVTYGIPVSMAVCGAGAGQANLLDYYARPDGEDWKVPRTVSVGGVTVTTSGYTASAGTTNSLAIAEQAGLPGRGLTWLEDYSASAPATATLTFSFSRAVSNFTLTAGDIDTGPGFIDQLVIQGYDASNALVAIPSTNVTAGITNSYSNNGSNGNNTFTGTGASAGLASSNIIATFPSAITRLVLTYRNTSTQANPALQGIVFPSFAWCAQADVQITLAAPVRAQASTIVTGTVTTLNVGNDLVTTIAPVVQLPTGLTNVTIGSYNSSTGVLTLPVIGNLAAGASVGQSITYRMPATGAVTATASFVSTADDPVAGNNTSTITTVQNRAPVASDVTNAPAILSSTTSQTAMASFNASDPDASAGNTALGSYTILSLPTAAQGTLYVNGAAATLNQVITVPTSATPAVPGYQLSFVPNGTFAGSASFTYKATDDTNTASNTATYFIPVTAGADLVSTVGGTPSGVEGQTKSYTVTTTNNGPATATGVVPTLTLSSKPPFSSITVTNGSYDPSTGVVTFTALPSLTNGATVVSSMTLVAQLAPPSFTLTAANTAATADPAPANNNGSAPAAVLTVTITAIGPAGAPSACATPGRDGSPTLTANPNTYFPATNQTLAVGATSLVVGSGVGTVPIATGDLLLVIQMQGADINFTNSDSYGDGVAGGLATSNLNNANFTAGLYEYVVAAAAVPLGGGTVTITTGLKNGYQNADATSAAGQRRFQVVRIPQYDNLTVSGTVAPSAWDGSTGGILALDVTGQLTFAAGARLDASGKGFRGGAGQKLNGIAGVTGTDYRNLAPATGTTTVGAHGMKGEGIAGTPRYVNTGTALLDTNVEGYPSGSAARGAPGNAGGGGTDATSINNQNSGGGGGGNGARGGRGGNTFSSNLAVGGEPGASFLAPSTSRLILGGGGGAGSTNGGSGSTGFTGYASSGAAGGGILLVRTGSVAGIGTLLANGAAASNAVVADGSGGGGGGGGSILLTANNPGSLGTLNLTASGGNGGSNSATVAEGPGGGGGGGIILSNAATASAVVANGTFGTSAGSAYGAAAGLPGIANNQINNRIAGSTAGISCDIDVTAAITAPAQAAAAQTVNVAAVFANNGGAAASGVTRTVTLSSGSNAAGNVVTNVVAPGSTSITPNALTGDVTIVYPGVSPLSAGASSQFNLSYTAPGTTSVVATASITTTSGESVTTNNTSVATTAITGYADVVGVIFGLGTSTTGRPSGTYGVLFANNGPAAALNVTRTVTLPPGSTLTTTQLAALTAQGATYDSGTLIIDFGNLTTWNSRAVSVFRIIYTASNTGGSTAIVTHITTTSQEDAGGGTGAPTAPDTFSFAITSNSTGDVATDGITASAPTAEPGQPVSFTLNFRNFGPGDAVNAVRSAQLMPGLSIVSVTGGGTCDPATGIVAYPIATMVSGSTAPSTITFLAPAIGPVFISGNMTTGSGLASAGIFGNNEATATMDVTPIADVATSISGPGASAVGNLVTYTLITANNGPSPAAGVVQTAQLPSGLAPTGVFASNQGTYNTSTGVVTFPAVAVLASAATLNNTVSFPMPTSGFTATAGVSTATAEAGATANNTATTGTTSAVAVAPTDPRANVYNTLDISSKNVAPGALATLTVLTGNNGPGPAQNVGQQLSLRPGLSIASGDISGGGTYDASTGVVTFPALVSLASGSTATNTVTLTAPAAGPLVAVASTTATTADPVPADNLATRIVDITSRADVATVLIGPAVASATQVIAFTVNTINNGPVPATNVVQTVSLPAGLAPGTVTATGGGSYAPATGLLTWPAVAALAVGEQRTYSYGYVAPAYQSTDANNPRVVVSQATVTSSTPDATTTNNSSVASTLIKWNADVAIAITGPASGIVGNPVVFAVSTTNNGPAPAAMVNTSVRIATGLNVVASGGGVYNINTGIVTFPAITNQAVGVTGVVTNTITVISPERPLVGASAAADIPTATNDIDLTNNAMTIYLPLSPITPIQTDFQVTLVADRTVQQAGQPVVLTLTATNANATGTAADMQAQVSLPGGMSGVVVSGGGTYDAASGAVTFPPANGQPANSTLTYTVTVNNPGKDPLVATAAINGNFSDAQPANNTQVVSVNINPVADVATRVSGPATALPGALTTYAVTTLNNGPSPASAVMQTVQLPTGLGAVTLSGGGTYDAASGLVTFATIATQAVGPAGAVTNTLAFLFPTTASVVAGTVASGTAESAGTTSDNTATLPTALTNQPPLANTVANLLQTPEGNTAGPLVLTALKGFDADGSVASFTITALPDPAAGVLALNGAAVTTNQVISNGNAANLTFDPATGFVGNASFAFTTTDNQGAVSAPAPYTIAVGQDMAAVYTATPLKGGANPYQDGDIVGNFFDANSGAYTAAAAVADNGVRTATAGSALPAGLELDPGSGQVRVLDRSLLVSGTYPVSFTTVDANGGVTTQTVSLRIGDYPLPVELTRFEAKAAGTDAQLSWATAQELDNAGFQVERSLDGTRFGRLDFVPGTGTTTQAHQYAYVDAGVGRQHPGTVYYRLQQLDSNGKATYSPVRALVFAPEIPGLYPNPAQTHTTLDLTSLPVATYDVTLLDMTGRVVQTQALDGGKAHELELSHLPAGAYLVIVRNNNLKIIKHLLKQ
ncbi:T9SS type A sorting domain-containing protein [Hymenobacter terricola]|uniref:T9SS type A sorting domain-containing protein n=1 Tax=Hymenobacter terricola TaxID=2819236 RepID=UPI001CF25BBE|nr:T9SS type A sorting domain-containing protein [Hymenobacter terricola]